VQALPHDEQLVILAVVHQVHDAQLQQMVWDMSLSIAGNGNGQLIIVVCVK
jgi:hypothetical protein